MDLSKNAILSCVRMLIGTDGHGWNWSCHLSILKKVNANCYSKLDTVDGLRPGNEN